MASRPPRILVVEDHRAIRDLVLEALEAEGYHVLTAANGLLGLAILDDLFPDLPALILLDMRMPEMDGWEFARRLRDGGRDSIPIVLMTASSDSDARRWALEIGAAATLRKPFDLAALVAVVADLAPLPPEDQGDPLNRQ